MCNYLPNIFQCFILKNLHCAITFGFWRSGHICSCTNGYDNEKMVLKLPLLLEGKALAIWLEFTTNKQKDYAASKKKIINAIKQMSFIISLDNFL